ncbi:MAG: hypothetical protein HN725_08860 [Alphaproteobacteria bacterium]|nr:hypothetical protein [Alphaproteobacteria bacterium]MBT4082556.1 hypothetical protein [Alphaproteobacteria bacterium]MBT5563015.1 hypothetical protein [Rhodospirillaceae bacterium]MBT7745386.1 hypothetical protein [Alphaproteobacteria bacterium]
MTLIHWLFGFWAVSAIAFVVFERFVPGERVWEPDEPWESVIVYGLLALFSPLIIIYFLFIVVIECSRIGWRWLISKLVWLEDDKRNTLIQLAEPWEPWEIDFTNPFIKSVRDLFLGPSVHRDDATADAVQAAICAGNALAIEIRADLEEAAVSAIMDITPALDTPLSVIDGGCGSTEPGSLLKAACVGTVAAVGIRELHKSRLAGSQTEVLHSMLARALTAWEVGQENIGHAPNPWLGNTHVCWAPGTLVGAKKSVANKLMEAFIMTGERTPEENAPYFARTIVSSLGFAVNPRTTNPQRSSILHQLGLGGGGAVLPESAINTVAERILEVDLFWPSYLEGKEVIW